MRQVGAFRSARPRGARRAVWVVAAGEGARLAAQAGATPVETVSQLPDVDGVVVVTPTTTHADVIESVLPRGVPIFCEKPLCHDPVRARRLAVAGQGRVFVMDKWRYHHGVLALAAIARSEELGPVVGLRTFRLGYGHSNADTDCVWTLLPHDLSIATEVLGTLPVPRHAVADMAGATVMGLVASSALDGGPWHVAEIGARSLRRQRSIMLMCANGVAALEDAYADHITIMENPPAAGASAEPRPLCRPIGTDMPLLVELAAFLDHLKGGSPPKSSVAEAAATVEAIASIRRLAAI
jgi:predicted dehydrogenase